MKLLLIFFAFIPLICFGDTTIDLTTGNSVFFRDRINQDSAILLGQRLVKLDEVKTKQPIYLSLRSEGGEVIYMMELVKLIKSLKRPVYTINFFSLSASFTLSQYSEKRYIPVNGIMMTHPAYFVNLTIDEHLGEVLQDTKVDYGIYLFVSKRMHIPISNYMAFMARQIFLKGQMAVDIHAADEIAEVTCTKDLILQGDCPW